MQPGKTGHDSCNGATDKCCSSFLFLKKSRIFSIKKLNLDLLWDVGRYSDILVAVVFNMTCLLLISSHRRILHSNYLFLEMEIGVILTWRNRR